MIIKSKNPDLTVEALIIGIFVWVAGCSVGDAIKDASKAEMDYRYRKERKEGVKKYFDSQATVDSLIEARQQFQLLPQP